MNQLTVAKTTAEQILSHPTWDILLVFALLAISFFYGISMGKRKIGATLIYTYVTLAVFEALPMAKILPVFGKTDPFLVKSAVFLALFLLLAFLLGMRQGFQIAPPSAWWQIFLLSFLQAGLAAHIILGFLPANKIALLAPLTRFVANPEWHIYWIVAPLAVLIILRRLESRWE